MANFEEKAALIAQGRDDDSYEAAHHIASHALRREARRLREDNA